MDGGGWLAMALVMLVLGGLVIAAVVFFVRSGGHRHDDSHEPVSSKNALHILDERFARGEIDEAEYGRRRQLLRST